MTDPFNAQDPFDTTAENVLTAMCKSALSVLDTPECQSLSPDEQFEALMCGMTTAILEIAFACVAPEGRDEITACIKDYIDRARAQVETLNLAEEMALQATSPPQSEPDSPSDRSAPSFDPLFGSVGLPSGQEE